MKQLSLLFLIFGFNCLLYAYELDEKATDKAALAVQDIAISKKWSLLNAQNYYYLLYSQYNLNQFPLVAVYVRNGSVVKVDSLHPLINVRESPALKDFMSLSDLHIKFNNSCRKLSSECSIELDPTFGFARVLELKNDDVNLVRKYQILDFGYIN